MVAKAIAVHTFLVLWGAKQIRSLVAWQIVGMFWTLDILISLILFVQHHEFYRPAIVSTSSRTQFSSNFVFCDQFWCWVNVGVRYELVTFYLWLWIAIAMSLGCYLPVFFLSRGYITRNANEPWWRFHIQRRHVDLGFSFNTIWFVP